MKCNKCGQENTTGSRFCCGCGSKLEKLCPQCQQPVAENARFCPSCGANLSSGINASAIMKDNVIAGNVNQSVHTNITNTTDQSVHASVVHIHQNEQAEDAFQDLRCHECAAFIPAAQKYLSACYKCKKHFCAQHLTDGYCTTCKTEQQLDMFEFIRQGNRKYSITKLKDLHAMRVSVPAIVESIGNKAFMGAEVIEVTLPEGLLKIGAQAFANCKDLTKINFPKSLEKIDDQAFMNCGNLGIAPPSGVRMGRDAFAGTLYANRQEQVRKAEETRKAEAAQRAEKARQKEEERKEFHRQYRLKASQKAFDNATFEFETRQEKGETVSIITKVSNNKTGNVILPECDRQGNLVVEIRGKASTKAYSTAGSVFAKASSVTSVTIPNSIKTIGESAFYNCTDLSSIKIPNSVTHIGREAFRGCKKLTLITIPNSVQFIGEHAFYQCTKLKNVYPSRNAQVDPTAFEGTIYQLELDEQNRIENEKQNQFIESTRAFATAQFNFEQQTKNGKTVSVVTSVGKFKTGHVIIPKHDPQGNLVVGIAGVLRPSDNKLVAPFEKGLKSVSIPDSITFIGDAAFAFCSELTSITLPTNLTEIGESAFRDCTNLTNITIPHGVTTIGKWAFVHCAKLDNVTIPSSVTSIDYGAFMGCASLKSITIPNSVKSIGEAALQDCTNLNTITLSNSITSIADNTFYNCNKLTNITIPNSVTKFGKWAFARCAKLDNVTIPNSVTSVEYGAFMNCSGLTSITISDSVTNIGEFAFTECTSLEVITLPKNIHQINTGTFENCGNLTQINLPLNVTNVAAQAFRNCAKLQHINHPDPQRVKYANNALTGSLWQAQASMRKREEEQKVAEQRKREAEQQAAEQRKREAERQAAEQRQREAERQAAEQRKREAERQAAEQRKREAERQAAEQRKHNTETNISISGRGCLPTLLLAPIYIIAEVIKAITKPSDK